MRVVALFVQTGGHGAVRIRSKTQGRWWQQGAGVAAGGGDGMGRVQRAAVLLA